jgi:uncharacterized BrkB/YihY/UPF0761 family membrane protein
MDEPGILKNENPEPHRQQQQQAESKSKENLASILAIGIVLGFLIILFAVIVIIINLLPGEDKLVWLFTEATYGTWILLVGSGLLIFFFALTVSIWIWKKGRGFLLKRI